MQRYSWEPWHYGFTLNAGTPRSASAADGATARAALPSFVPARFAPRARARPRSAGTSRPRCSRRSSSRVELQPVRALAGRRAGDRAVHAGHRAGATGLRDPFDAARRDRRAGAPHARPAAPVRLGAARARRLQRRPGARRRLRLRPAVSPRRAATSRGSSACSAAPATRGCDRLESGSCDDVPREPSRSRATRRPYPRGGRRDENLERDDAAPAREQRTAALPDEPGVYLFRDAGGRVIYVGKANSIRKRVASHFSGPTTQGGRDDRDGRLRSSLVVATEAEALLAEQNFIKQYKPRFNIRLRDDKSYPYIAISLDEDVPARLLHARAPPPRARLLRPVLERQAGARDARPARQGLPVPHLRGPRARAAAAARRASTTTSSAARRPASATSRRRSTASDRRRDRLPLRPLPGRSRRVERGCSAAAAEQEFEHAALARNRLRRSVAARAPAGRERVGRDARRGRVAVDGTDANAQVFQVRDGVLSDRQCFYLENEAADGPPAVAEEFLLQYYGGALAIPPQLIVPREVGATAERSRRRSPSGAVARSRCAPPSAATSAASSSSPSATRALRSTRRGCAPSADASSASRRSSACRRRSGSTRFRCASSASTSRTWRARTPSRRWSCSRAARRRRPTTGASSCARASRACRTTSPRWRRCSRRRLAQYERQHDRSPHDQDYDDELRRAAQPDRDRRRQGPAVGRSARARRFRDARRRGRLAREADRGGLRPWPRGADRAAARHAGAAAAAARARRGAPLCDRATTASAATRR